MNKQSIIMLACVAIVGVCIVAINLASNQTNSGSGEAPDTSIATNDGGKPARKHNIHDPNFWRYGPKKILTLKSKQDPDAESKWFWSNDRGFKALTQGKLNEAENYYQQALKESEPLGKDKYATSLCNLAAVAKERRQFSQAEKLLQKSIDTITSISSDSDPRLWRPFNALGELKRDQGQMLEAERYLTKSIQLLEKEQESKDLARSQSELGFLYLQKGEPSKAKPLLEQSVATRQRLLGTNEETLWTNTQLAVAYAKLKENQKAKNAFGQSIAMTEQLAGNNSRELLFPLAEQAEILMAQKNFSEAKALLDRALAIQEKSEGKKSVRYANLLKRAGTAEKMLADYSQSEARFNEALLLQKQLGARPLELGWTETDLAFVMRVKGDMEKAAKHFRLALEHAEKQPGVKPDELALFEDNLAFIYRDQKKFSEAEREFKRALEHRQKVLKAEDDLFKKSVFNLYLLYRDCGRNNEAMKLAQSYPSIFNPSVLH